MPTSNTTPTTATTAAAVAGGAHGDDVRPRTDEKKRLRAANASMARALVHRAKLTHAQVNAELNRLSGVRRVSEATLQELERRLAAGERWLLKV